jgi:plasmid maintenance system antidote protein VapI
VTIRKLNTWAAEIQLQAAARGMRLCDIADVLGVSQVQLSKLVRQPEVTEAYFMRITRALGMKPSDWGKPLQKETTLDRARRMRRNATGKNRRWKKPAGVL